MNETGLEYALHRAHHGENEIVEQLTRMADRHRADHEIHHVALDLVRRSRENIARLADIGSVRDVPLSREARTPGTVRHALDTVMSKTPGTAPVVLLLEDLRDLYLACTETSLAWEMLAQLAQARRDDELLAAVSGCHPQTLRQLRWANTMIKTLSPQALASL